MNCLRTFRSLSLLAAMFGAAPILAQVPLDSEVTYQGRLKIGNSLPNVPTNVRFRLYDAAVGGALLGQNIILVTPSNGLFTATLDFGFPPFTPVPDERWLELAVFDGVGFVTLTPRQPLTAAPFALRAVQAASATSAGDASTLDGVDSTQFLRSDTNDQYTAGTLTFNAGTSLDVIGGFRARSMVDGDNASFFVDPSNTGTAIDIAGSIAMQPGEGVIVNNGTFTLGGANVIINLGDSTADQVIVPAGEFFIRTSEGTSSIFFFEDGLANGESFSWNDTTDSFTLSDDLSITGLLTISSNLAVSNGTGVNVGSAAINAAGAWTIGGANIVIRLGDSSADQLVVPAKDLFMSDTTTVTDGDQTIWFTDNSVATTNFLRWDDVTAVACADNIGNIDSAFDWHIEDNVNSNWNFTSAGADIECTIDENGNMNIDGTLLTSNGCDLAESFLGAASLAPGTIVVLDPTRPEAVVASSAAYQTGIAGVISTQPGVVMRGATADVYPLYQEMLAAESAASRTSEERALLEQLATVEASDDTDETNAANSAALREDLKTQIAALVAARKPAADLKTELERRIDGWTRGNVDVALAGRVPVRVVGPVQPGQYLTTSSTPGVAMAMTQSGPTIGPALSAFDGNGEGTVLVLIQPGWHGGAAAPAQAGGSSAELDAVRAENAQLKARLDALEQAVSQLVNPR
ncbi:MAG: hypothetical protein U1D55_14280 [Phycisphaerae bacterium]